MTVDEQIVRWEAELEAISAELLVIAQRNANAVPSPAAGSKPDAAGPYAVGHMAYVREKRAREAELIALIAAYRHGGARGTVSVGYGVPQV